jgi:predicted nucleic acid-binding protein
MNFWDSSAIIPCVVEQKLSKAVRAIRESDPVVAVWWASRVECVSALCREKRDGRLSAVDCGTASELLRQWWNAAYEILPSEKVRQRAERLLNTHSLRAADALQLAAALVCVQEMPQAAGFVSLDARLRKAAAEEGFSVFPREVTR